MSTIKAMPRPADIIVVGAGVVGCAVACELARRGASVQIVEQRAAGRHGAQLMEGWHVRRSEAAESDVTVEPDRGALAGSAVVLAAGSWSPQIEIAGVAVRGPVRPIRGQLLRLAWKGPMLRRVVWSDRCYLVPW